MRILLLIAFSGIIMMTGCSSSKPTCPQPPERIINIPLEVPGSELSENDARRLRSSENLKAYYTGRYIDPNNPDVMYESNTLYRVEKKNDWVKTPRPVEGVPTGVAMRIGPDKENQALITEFKKDMRTLQMTLQKLTSLETELKTARTELISAQKIMKGFEGQIGKSQEQNAEIVRKCEELQSKISSIENKILFSAPAPAAEAGGEAKKEEKSKPLDKLFK